MPLPRPLSTPENCGLAIVGEFYGEPLSPELLERVRSTPDEQLEVLWRWVSDAMVPGSSPGHSWSDYDADEDDYEPLGFKPWPVRKPEPTGSLVHPGAMLNHVPLSRRPRLSLLLLLGPSVVVQDPVASWVGGLRSGGRRGLSWVTGAPYGDRDGAPQDVLAAILAGMAPLAPLIRSGVVVMAKPDDGYAMWTDVLGTAADLAGSGANPEIVAHALTGLVEGTGALPVPEGLESYFASQSSTDAIGWDLPLLDLTLNDALAMRANEQVFATMRVALGEVARNAGRSEPGEQEGAFAARVRSAAEDALPPVEEELRSLISRGRLFGVIPGVVGGAVRLAAGLLPFPLPGAGTIGSAVARKALSRSVDTGSAAQTALRYSTNLRLVGRL